MHFYSNTTVRKRKIVLLSNVYCHPKRFFEVVKSGMKLCLFLLISVIVVFLHFLFHWFIKMR